MDSDIQELLSLYSKGMSKQSGKKFQCLCPDCEELAILSHSLQRKTVLESISDKYKKIIGIDKGTNSLKSYFTKSVKFKKYGIGEASVFKGFCNKHDTQIFEEIENGNFKPYLLRHNILLFFREASYQYSDRRDIDEIMKYIKNNLSVFNKYKSRLFSFETDKHEQDYMKYLVDKMYKDISNNKLDDYDFLCYIVNKKYELACLTIVDLKLFYPELIVEKNQNTIFCFSLFDYYGYTVVSFSFFKKYRLYIKNLLKDNFENFVNRIIFSYSERTFFNPEYWHKLDKTYVDYCEKSFVYPLVRDNEYFDPPHMLDKFCSHTIPYENNELPEKMQELIDELQLQKKNH